MLPSSGINLDVAPRLDRIGRCRHAWFALDGHVCIYLRDLLRV